MRTEERNQKVAGFRLQASGLTLKACGLWFVACSLLLVAWSASPAFAGNIDSPAAPSDDSGRMYTLEQIYDKVTDGTTPTKHSGGFNEPAAGPGSTMHTLDDIEAKIAAGTTTATPGDVLNGKTFITRIAGRGESMLTGSMIPHGIPKTGQTTNYRTGDDETYANPAGSYDVGLPQGESTWASYWSARFTDNGDGTVTDNATGLMWAKDGDGPGCNNGAILTWNQAMDWAEALIFAGYDDWRLPNIYELFSICVLEAGAIPGVKNAGGPYINQTIFPNTRVDYYFSSTTYPRNTGDVLIVHFGSGSVRNYGKSDFTYVRAVRGGVRRGQ